MKPEGGTLNNPDSIIQTLYPVLSSCANGQKVGQVKWQNSLNWTLENEPGDLKPGEL